MAKRDPNWGQVGHLLPIATLSDSYTGPVVLANVTGERIVRWFVAKANKDAVEHQEHRRGEEHEGFLHKPQTKKQAAEGQPGEPVMDSTMLEPTHWAFAEIIK